MVKKLIFKGIPIVLSAPSGGGKTTISERLLKKSKNLRRSVSCTTRAPRKGERNGVDYTFLSESQFKKKIRKKEFLEWAMVHGQYYGTPVGPLTQKLKKGSDVMLVIDPQGAVSIRKIYPRGVFIFVVPPTWALLKKRLIERRAERRSSLKIRLKDAKKELTYLKHYDYLVVNNRLSDAVSDVQAIIRAEKRCLQRLDPKKIPIFRS